VVYDWLSSIGAHHMSMPAFAANFPSHDKLPGRVPAPDDSDSEDKRKTMARSYAGAKAHVIEWAKGSKRVSHAAPEELAKVDDHHRLLGMVTHLLFSNSDGHAGNVLIDKSGHPVMIDHDVILNSTQNQIWRNLKMGRRMVRSVFAPGEVLAYNANGKTWGNNFPPEVTAVLSEIAQGGWAKRHGLSRGDEAELQQNANDLLTHGVEKTLDQRDIVPMKDVRRKKRAP